MDQNVKGGSNMPWCFFQELLAAKPEDMARLWQRARSKFRDDNTLTAEPKMYDPRLVKESIRLGPTSEVVLKKGIEAAKNGNLTELSDDLLIEES
jgi:hypothetical protein